MSDRDLATILAEEAALAETEVDSDDDVWVRSRRPPKAPSMVYSVRIPVDRVEELRRVAAAAGVEPSAMVRQWVLDRLDAELSEDGRAAGEVTAAVAQLIAALKRGAEDRPWGLFVTPDSGTFLRLISEPPVQPQRAVAKKAVANKGAAKTASAAGKRTTATLKGGRGSKSVAAKADSKTQATAKAASRRVHGDRG